MNKKKLSKKELQELEELELIERFDKLAGEYEDKIEKQYEW